jgi:hypothetical protein
MKTFISNYFF